MAGKYAIACLLALCAGTAYAAAGEYNYKLSGLDWPGTCQTGMRQTPIDVKYADTVKLEDLKRAEIMKAAPDLIGTLATDPEHLDENLLPETDYTPDFLHIAFNTTAFEYVPRVVSYLALKMNTTEQEIKDLAAQYIGVPLQMHWHSTSEHTIEGQIFAAEGHLVRKIPCVNASDATMPDGVTCLGVMGVMLHLGDEHEGLTALYGPGPDMPAVASELRATADSGWNEPKEFSVPMFFPEECKRTFIAYEGSLTTPPCSEPVQWVLYDTPIPMSSDQLVAFQNMVAANRNGSRTDNRPTMPVNGRTIYHA